MRPHVKSIPAEIQRFLHNRTFRQKPGGSERQPWTHNQSTPQGHEKDTHDRENLPAVLGRTSGKSQRRQKNSTSQ